MQGSSGLREGSLEDATFPEQPEGGRGTACQRGQEENLAKQLSGTLCLGNLSISLSVPSCVSQETLDRAAVTSRP